jgi:hypothetical protein
MELITINMLGVISLLLIVYNVVCVTVLQYTLKQKTDMY